MADTPVYALDVGGNRVETLTADQIIAAINAAISTGEIPKELAALVEMIKEQNKGDSIKIWLGTTAEFLALESTSNDIIYLLSDSTDLQDLDNELNLLKEQLQDGSFSIYSADHATNADHATSADSATKATQDGSGNNIEDTYATKQSLSNESSARNSMYLELDERIDDIIDGSTPPKHAWNATNATNADVFKAADTRNDDQMPRYYMTEENAMTSIIEYKTVSAIAGLSDVIPSTYCMLKTIIPSDSISGGLPIQIAYEANAANPYIAVRAGETFFTWGTWRRITTSNILEDYAMLNQVVRYDSGQNLTDEQKFQAQNNMRVSAIKELNTAGWYRVLSFRDSGIYGELIIRGSWNLNMPTTAKIILAMRNVAYLENLNYSQIIVLGNINSVNAIRIVAGNPAYIDIYYEPEQNNRVSIEFNGTSYGFETDNISAIDFTNMGTSDVANSRKIELKTGMSISNGSIYIGDTNINVRIDDIVDGTTTVAKATQATRFYADDTRNTNQPPDWYQNSDNSKISMSEFKSTSAIGVDSILTDSRGLCMLYTIIPWGDSSGGMPIQIAVQSNTAAGRAIMAMRSGISDTEWGAWKRIATTDDIKVESVAGKTGAVTLTKSDVGLGNVDNTADANKSVASAVKATRDVNDNVINETYATSLAYFPNNGTLGLLRPGGYYLSSVKIDSLPAVSDDNYTDAVNPSGRNPDSGVGNYSVAFGYNVNASGTESVAIGYNAFGNANNAVAIGAMATAGTNSVAINGFCSANNSVAIGRSSSVMSNNSTALGYNAQIPISSNGTMRLGATDLSKLECAVQLTQDSDERDKTDIEDITDALKFITKLNPKTYVRNPRDYYISDEDRQSDDFKMYGMCNYDKQAYEAGEKKGTRRRSGLLAQEILSAISEVYGTDNYANIVNDSFYDLDEKPENVENKYTVAYEALIPFLIGAIKELKAEIDELKGVNNG